MAGGAPPPPALSKEGENGSGALAAPPHADKSNAAANEMKKMRFTVFLLSKGKVFSYPQDVIVREKVPT